MFVNRTKFTQSIRHQPSFFSTSTLFHRSSVHSDQSTSTTDLLRGNSTDWKSSFEWEPELQRRQRVAKERRPKASKFVDQLKVLVRAGSGGDGGVAFHREKFVARGGPSGGNGGQGGSVYLRPSTEVQSLNRIPKTLRADPGSNGGGQWMSGQAGKDLIIDVPIGTVVREIRTSQTLAQRRSSLVFDFGSRPPKAGDLLGEDIQIAKTRRSKLFVHYPESEDSNQSNEVLKKLEINLLQEQWEVEKARSESVPLLIDCAEFHENHLHQQVSNSNTQVHRLSKPDQDYFLVAKGGEGGLGNSNFSGNQTTLPRFATRGRRGEVVELELELKTLADVGLVGFPNSGKSTLIHTLTNSRAEIAPYPFTTLNPQIGTLTIFNDGTWDVDEQHNIIQDSPSPKEYLDAVSANDLIRDRSNRRSLSKDQSNHKCESMRLTIADCPGLLPRASENVGLGHAFLRHIERSKMLIVVIDLMAGLPISTSSTPKLSKNRVGLRDGDPERCCRDVETLFKELESYQTGLSGRVGILIANKADLSSSDDNLKQIAQVRLQLLRHYIDSVSSYQVENGLRNPSLISQEIVVLPISAKFRLNIKKLVALIQQFFEFSKPQ